MGVAAEVALVEELEAVVEVGDAATVNASVLVIETKQRTVKATTCELSSVDFGLGSSASLEPDRM